MKRKKSYEFKGEMKFIGESKLMTVDTPMGSIKESDLVSFGNYLLSNERRSMIQGDPNVVYHADLKNWETKKL